MDPKGDDNEATEQAPAPDQAKENNALAQLAADAFASPLLYVTVGAFVAVKVVSSSEQVCSSFLASTTSNLR